MLIPGLVSVTCKKQTPQEIVQICTKTGLQGLEWSENWHLQAGDVKQALRVANLTKNSGLEIAAYGSYIRLGESKDVTPSLESAAALGAPVIRIWGGQKASTDMSESELDAMVEQAKLLALEAMSYNLVVALEWHKNTVTDTNESAFNFLERVHMPNFKTLWQPTQALTVAQRVEGLRKVANQVMNLHVYHWDGSGRRPLEEGEAEWKTYLETMWTAGRHYALLEFVKDDDMEQLEKDISTLHSWLSE